MTKLSARLPDMERNGLGSIASTLASVPHQTHVVIAVIDCKSITTDMDSGAVVPTARIRRIEVVPTDRYTVAERLMREAIEDRNGSQWLPIEDLDDEFKHVFRTVLPHDRPIDVSGLQVMPDDMDEDDEGGDES